jgi:hypothetical protein
LRTFCPRFSAAGVIASTALFLDHLFRVAACLDGLENGSHVSVTETERARLAIKRVANIEQWRGDALLASRFGDQAIVLEDVRDRCLDREIAGDTFRRLLARDGHLPSARRLEPPRAIP